MNVLIVDDEPLARDRLNRMVQAIPGCKVVAQAGSGQEA
ncbi:MAG: DNA-binding response regulator, partial [Porticoccaceae bacterium]|nr:DNA-binding response regulator [Porticoccaceae bacterium]